MKILVAVILLVCTLAFAAHHKNGEDSGPAVCDNIYPQTGPFYAENFAANPAVSPHPGTLLFLSYNVNFSGDMKGITKDLAKIPQFSQADFVLFEEVIGDIGGVHNTPQTFAKQLGMNYVFAPAIVYHGKEDYGNAILSRWPLHDFRKVVLPRSSSEKCNQRIALGVTADIGGKQIEVYVIHLATIFPDTFEKERWRAKQMKAAIDDMNLLPLNMPSFIAGDLNTVNPWGWRGVEQLMTENHFINSHPNQGWTHKPTRQTLDHTFARNLEYISSGNFKHAVGSDHIPIWTQLTGLLISDF